MFTLNFKIQKNLQWKCKWLIITTNSSIIDFLTHIYLIIILFNIFNVFKCVA